MPQRASSRSSSSSTTGTGRSLRDTAGAATFGDTSAKTPWAIVRFDPITGAAHAFPLATKSRDRLFLDGLGDPNGLACTVRGSCTALGITGIIHDQPVITRIADGKITSITALPGVSQLSGLECRGSGNCMAAGLEGLLTAHPQGVLVDVDSSAPPQTHAISGTTDLTAVRCLSADRCVAVGDAAGSGAHGTIVRLDGPQVHVARVSSIPSLSGVTRPTSRWCWTVGVRYSVLGPGGL